MAILHAGSKRDKNKVPRRKVTRSDSETAYLLGNSANAEHLRRALRQFDDGQTHQQ